MSFLDNSFERFKKISSTLAISIFVLECFFLGIPNGWTLFFLFMAFLIGFFLPDLLGKNKYFQKLYKNSKKVFFLIQIFSLIQVIVIIGLIAVNIVVEKKEGFYSFFSLEKVEDISVQFLSLLIFLGIIVSLGIGLFLKCQKKKLYGAS